MLELLFKRIVRVDEYYRIAAESEAEGYRKINEMLRCLAERLSVFQEESFPSERVVVLEGNDHIELVESLPPDDGEDLSPHSLKAANAILRYDLVMQNVGVQPDGFPITSETLQQLPPFVAAVVGDYSTHEEEQHWFLHDIQYDLQGLDPLPIDDGSTCEIWTQGWVWRGRKGTISLSPLMAQPQGAELEDAFAWAVERENTGTQHIRVWRIRCLESQPPDPPDRTQIVSEPSPQPLKHQQAGGEKGSIQANKQENDEALLAVVCPDDCPGVSFNVIPWLQKADDAAIETLREISSGSNYFCDQVAQDVRDDDTLVEAVMAYCEATNHGFSCALPVQATEEWIRHNRPSLAKTASGIQDAG